MRFERSLATLKKMWTVLNLASISLHVAMDGLDLTPVFLCIFIFFLMCLAYGDVIHVNYRQLAESVSGFAEAVSPTFGLLIPLVSHLPLISSLILGLMFGFKKD